MPTMSVRVFEDSERGALVSWYPRDGTCLGGDPVSQVGEGVTDDAEFEQFVGLGQLVTEVLRHALDSLVLRRSATGLLVNAVRRINDVARPPSRPAFAKLLPASGRANLHLTRRWLAENAEAYVGTWVALRDGGLVFSDKSRRAVHEWLLEHARDVRGIIVMKVE